MTDEKTPNIPVEENTNFESKNPEITITNPDNDSKPFEETKITIQPTIIPSMSMESIKSSTSLDSLNPMTDISTPVPPVPPSSDIILPSARRKFRLREIFRKREKIKSKARLKSVKTKPKSAFWSKVSNILNKCLPKRSYEKKKPIPAPLYNEMTPEDKNRVRSLIIDLGYALSVYGVPSHRLEERLTQVSTYFGLDGSYFSTPTAIWFSFGGNPSDLSTSYHLVRVKSNAIDLHKLCLIDDLAYAISKGKYTLREARKKINEIVAAETNYSNPFIQIISYSMAALSMAILLDATWAELLAAAIGGLVVGFLNFAASKFEFISQIFTITSALACGLIAIVFRIIFANSVRVSVFLVNLSGIIALVPGLTLTLSMAEIATNNILSGAARLMRVLITALQLGFGVAIAYRIGSFFSIKDFPSTWTSPEWLIAISSLIGTMAYSIQFHAPKYPLALIMMFISTYAGHNVAKYGGIYLGSELGPMCGALLIGVLANIYGKISKHPGIVVTAVGILLLVPGSISVRSVNALIENDAISGIFFIFNMFMIGLSLVIGLFISHFIVPSKRLSL